MQWDDTGYLVSKNKYNENSLIAEFFTENHGKSSGIIFGATSKKSKSYLQIGNKLHLTYTFKNENKIGYFKTEIFNAYTPLYFENNKKLSCIVSAMNLIKLLTVESQSNLNIFKLIDKLFFPHSKKFSYLHANFPRIIVDANRSPLEIDKTMWENNNLDNLFDVNSLRVLNGIGVFAKYNLFGQYIYSAKIPFSEAKWRLLKFYFPYHKKIKEIIKKTKENHKKIIALDCHSMSSELVSSKTDIVISNVNNKSCSNEILLLVKKS